MSDPSPPGGGGAMAASERARLADDEMLDRVWHLARLPQCGAEVLEAVPRRREVREERAARIGARPGGVREQRLVRCREVADEATSGAEDGVERAVVGDRPGRADGVLVAGELVVERHEAAADDRHQRESGAEPYALHGAEPPAR